MEQAYEVYFKKRKKLLSEDFDTGFRAWEKLGETVLVPHKEFHRFSTNVNFKYCRNAASFRKPSQRWESDEFSAREKHK